MTVLHPSFDSVRKRNHTDRLPNAKTNARCYSPVETLDAVFFVDEVQGIQHGQLFGAISIGSRLCH